MCPTVEVGKQADLKSPNALNTRLELDKTAQDNQLHGSVDPPQDSMANRTSCWQLRWVQASGFEVGRFAIPGI